MPEGRVSGRWWCLGLPSLRRLLSPFPAKEREGRPKGQGRKGYSQEWNASGDSWSARVHQPFRQIPESRWRLETINSITHERLAKFDSGMIASLAMTKRGSSSVIARRQSRRGNQKKRNSASPSHDGKKYIRNSGRSEISRLRRESQTGVVLAAILR